MIVLLPEADRAVVMLQNAYGPFQDSGLAGTGLNTARLLAGEEPTAAGADPSYPLLLAGLAAVASALLAGLGWSVYRLIRPRPRASGRRRVVIDAALWTGAGGVIALAAGVLLPAAVQFGLREVLLWAPDLGATLLLIIGAAVGLSLLRWAIAFRLLRLAAPQPR